MKLTSLKSRLFLSFIAIVLTLGASILLLGYYVISIDIVGRARQQVLTNLKGAHTAYLAEIARIGDALKIGSPSDDTETLRKKINLHYLFRMTAKTAEPAPMPLSTRFWRQAKASEGRGSSKTGWPMNSGGAGTNITIWIPRWPDRRR
jgi:hypothetical protein